MRVREPSGPMSYEEWLEIRLAHEREAARLSRLLAVNPVAFWREPRVEKCSERMVRYLDKTKELQKNDPFGVFS